MTSYEFDLSFDREVIAANYVFYEVPVKHPDRIMDCHDIFYVIDGQETVILENEEFYINPGDLMLLPAQIHHYGKQPYKLKTYAVYIHFSTKKKDRRPDSMEDGGFLSPLVFPVFMHADNPQILNFFRNIAGSWLSNSPVKSSRCSALLNLLLMELSDTAKQTDVKKNPVINEVINFINSHPQKFYTIAELTKYSGLSSRSLTTHFREATGQTIHNYQMNMKLDHIAILMRNKSFSNLSVMATNFGFYDEYHLNNCFKKKFGISPIRYSKHPH